MLTTEARAINDLEGGRFVEAAGQAWGWLRDQRFSRYAAVFGSYVSSIALDDHEEALSFATAGLQANPGDWLLMNNQAFSLASLDRVSEAGQIMAGLQSHEADPLSGATVLATRGLLLFRRGFVTAGRDRYRTAISMLESAGHLKAAALAAVLHAREEILADQDGAQQVIERASTLSKGIQAPEVTRMLRRVEELLRARVRSNES